MHNCLSRVSFLSFFCSDRCLWISFSPSPFLFLSFVGIVNGFHVSRVLCKQGVVFFLRSETRINRAIECNCVVGGSRSSRNNLSRLFFFRKACSPWKNDYVIFFLFAASFFFCQTKREETCMLEVPRKD